MPTRQFFASKHVIWPAGQAIVDAHPSAVAEHDLSGHATGLSSGHFGGQEILSVTQIPPTPGHFSYFTGIEGHGQSDSAALQFASAQAFPAVAFAARQAVRPEQEMGLSAGQGWAPPYATHSFQSVAHPPIAASQVYGLAPPFLPAQVSSVAVSLKSSPSQMFGPSSCATVASWQLRITSSHLASAMVPCAAVYAHALELRHPASLFLSNSQGCAFPSLSACITFTSTL
jgi:hypothetical protein